MVGQLVSGVESSEKQANAAVDGMLNKTADVHDAMIALQRADLTLQFGVQVRNKLVNAYQEIMRMPV
jgi:flagellar hook-basal body complex protein FliE